MYVGFVSVVKVEISSSFLKWLFQVLSHWNLGMGFLVFVGWVFLFVLGFGGFFE